MVISCCVLGCKNRQGCKPNLSFYRIPTEPKRRQRWIAAISRTDWQPNPHTRICSDHFVNGRKIDNQFSVDFVPSVFLPTLVKTRRWCKRNSRPGQCRSQTVSSVPRRPPARVTSRSWVNDLSPEHVRLLQRYCRAHQRGAFIGREKLRSRLLGRKRFRNKDKLEALTGLQNDRVLMAVLGLVHADLRNTSHMSRFQQLLVTLMKLRVNFPLSLFSYLLGVRSSTISGVFRSVINVLNDVLVPMCVLWPKTEHVQTSLPLCFRKSFKRCVWVVDCFEVFLDKPRARCGYKAPRSLKYVLGVTPQGVCCFVSKGWGGRTPDDLVTVTCGLADHLLPGDLVLAGLAVRRAEAFRGGVPRLVEVDLGGVQEVTEVHAHVREVAGRGRCKYEFLQQPVSFSLLWRDGEYTVLDKIVRVTCALTNLCPAVTPLNT